MFSTYDCANCVSYRDRLVEAAPPWGRRTGTSDHGAGWAQRGTHIFTLGTQYFRTRHSPLQRDRATGRRAGSVVALVLVVIASILTGQAPAQAGVAPHATVHGSPGTKAEAGVSQGDEAPLGASEEAPGVDNSSHVRVPRQGPSRRLKWTVVDGSEFEVGGAVFELEGPRDNSGRSDSIDAVWTPTQGRHVVVKDAVLPNDESVDFDTYAGKFEVNELTMTQAVGVPVYPAQRYRIRPIQAPPGWEFTDTSWVTLPGEQPNSGRARAGVWVTGDADFGRFTVRRVEDTQLVWRVTDTSGRLIGGATATVEGPSTGWGTSWPTAASIPDCVSAPCQGLDTDPAPGAFRLTSEAARASGVLGGLRAGGRFRVRLTTPPNGFTVQSSVWATIPGTSDQGTWNNQPKANSHDFGNLGVAAYVPPPPPAPATITVRVGGDRTRDGVTSGLQGVALVLNTGEAGPSGARPDGVPGDAPGWARCVSDGSGICRFSVPDTQLGGRNRDARFWVTQTGTPAGWYANPTLRTGTAATQGAATEYRFRTGQELRSGSTYASTAEFMTDQRDIATASSGVWQQSRTNPSPPPGCSANVALILDYSSVGAAQNDQLRAATDGFVDSLLGTKTKLSLFSFSDTTPALRASQNYGTLAEVETAEQAEQFKSRYRSWTMGGGSNWDRGLAGPAEVDRPGNHFDLALVITDGNPTNFGNGVQGNGRSTRFTELENAVFSANQLKAKGTRVVAVGVGANAAGAQNALNLRAITGPSAGNDYFQVPDFASASQRLQQMLGGSCAAPITVTNMIVPLRTPPGEITDATPAGAGWTFTARDPGPGLGMPSPASRTTTGDGSGSVEFAFKLPAESTRSAPVTIETAVLPEHTLVTPSGKAAVCREIGSGAEVPAAAAGANAFRVSARRDTKIGCTVYYRVPDTSASLSVTKNWVVQDVDGKTTSTFRVPGQTDGLPAGLSASLRFNGPGLKGESVQSWGEPRSKYLAGDTVRIVESAGVDGTLLPGCSMVSQRATRINSTAIDEAVPYVAPLVRGANTVEVTNTLRCEQTLELRASVDNGPANASAWTLSASAPNGARPGPTGRFTGQGSVRGSVTAAAAYGLAASGGNDVGAYAQRGPWACSDARSGAAVPLPDGRVSVPLGRSVICEVRNATAELTVFTDVVDGALSPARLVTEGAPVGEPPGLPTVRWAGVASGVASPPEGGTVSAIRPDQRYRLTERASDGTALAYLITKIQRWDGGNWVDVASTGGAVEVSVPIGTHAYYRYVNARAPTLSVPHTGGTPAELFVTLGALLGAAAAVVAITARSRRGRGSSVREPASATLALPAPD